MRIVEWCLIPKFDYWFNKYSAPGERFNTLSFIEERILKKKKSQYTGFLQHWQASRVAKNFPSSPERDKFRVRRRPLLGNGQIVYSLSIYSIFLFSHLHHFKQVVLNTHNSVSTFNFHRVYSSSSNLLSSEGQAFRQSLSNSLKPQSCYSLQFSCKYYRGADKSLARPTYRCILFDAENISFDTSFVIYINSTNIPPIMIINGIYETQNLLSL
jgi:hypothetical protein